MRDLNETENEIVDLDACPKMKSILIATVVTGVLGFVGYSYIFLCIHYVIGGLTAAGHFAKRYKISFSGLVGAKLGALSSFLGMCLTYIGFPLWALPAISVEEWTLIREEFIKQAYESGQPEAAEVGETLFVPENVTIFLIGIFTVGTVISLILGAVGGLLGASFFKKGPEAK